ncbi:vam6/Vps39-like protein [Biomphalaria glabrata]|uniref:Vam6/Vps39-like protein n=1 Tax=Biomphalaria glabrata TaxID=6526 RepID=A0A9W2ZUD4_BIOGL|nr:vam6/Vps39-like protein [Biomphalaria glabrata]
MPHNAYEAIPILEKLPLTIESIACYESTLLVGTKQGVLLLYKVIKQKSRGTNGEVKFDVTLDRSNKSFAKKPITQLAAVPELFLLISLSDNVISVHDLTNFQQICCVQKTKGATLFAVDVQKRETHTGIDYYLRMGVASKRKIQLFYWENREFQELRQDLSLYDFPHALSWCQNSLCVGFKRDYFMINTKSGNLKELFPVGASQPDPLVTPLSDNRLALGRDAMSILINADGDPTQKEPITWSDIPIAMEHCPPYLIAILNKFVEVRTIDPKMMIQNISLPKARFICQGSGSIYAASPNNVWCLAPVPNSEQIRQLLTGKEFELALKLAELADEEPTEKQTRMQNIKNLYAFHLFCQMRFDESLTLFAKLGTDPSHVIGLYPNLLPEEFRKKLEYPDKVPDISGSNYEKGIMALIEYLTQKRNELNKEGYKETSTTAIVEGNKTITSRKQLSQIIDTTLLKCYLQTNDALVAPLLRLKDNNCHIEESERVLKKKEKFSELIILYEKKGLHQKALSTLMKQAARPESPLKGHERTVQYLQHLGKDHIDLIFEYAVWVLKQYPEDGLKIFTEDLPEIENLPRDQVLDFLEKVSPDLAIPYLEYIVFERKDQKEEFHNRLVDAYRERVQKLDEEINSFPESQKAGAKEMQQRSLRDECKKKLISFLLQSKHYLPERHLTKFPTNGFHEERAILLGRLGRHEQALGIYVYTLKDFQRAEDYCAKNYDSNKEGNKDVYYLLLKLILKATDGPQMNGPSGKQLESALKLLEDHAMKIDTAKALELLPSTTKLTDILAFLENVLEHQTAHRRSNQILKSILYAENLQVTEHLIHKQSVKIIVTEEDMCRSCKRRIGQSVFCRYSNGHLVHYSCYTKDLTSKN